MKLPLLDTSTLENVDYPLFTRSTYMSNMSIEECFSKFSPIYIVIVQQITQKRRRSFFLYSDSIILMVEQYWQLCLYRFVFIQDPATRMQSKVVRNYTMSKQEKK